ncbi:hypothetical protein GCM10009547_08140 [Sporichthya brevicatena]|uniref:HTH cro/C1-type domain-containing protein n=1 Tax=Sporichthya brevicatena TaxID=171442 RepID=A0ABP3RJS9_9ACTN
MLLLLALVVFLLFAGLGFFAHVFWLGLLAAALLLVLHMWREGLARETPTSRFNVRLVAAFRGFLDDLLSSRARQRAARVRESADAGTRTAAPVGTPALPPGDDLDAEIQDAEIVEDEAQTAVAKRRANRWRAMTPAKIAQAQEMADAGATQKQIARKLGVSRSTVSRHLAARS